MPDARCDNCKPPEAPYVNGHIQQLLKARGPVVLTAIFLGPMTRFYSPLKDLQFFAVSTPRRGEKNSTSPAERPPTLQSEGLFAQKSRPLNSPSENVPLCFHL